MKKYALLFVAVLMSALCYAQLGNLLERAKEKTKNKVNQRVDQKMDKAIDKTLDEAENTGKNKKTGSTGNTGTDKQPEQNDNAGTETKSSGNSSSSLKSYSKFDFVPGEKLVTAEDFSQDAVGDFPARWNSNGSGEIVTTNKSEGKFLLTQKEVVFYPEWVKNLPDNFTLEFDLLCSDQFSFYSGYFNVGFTSATDIGKDFRSFANFGDGRIENGGGFQVGFHPQNAGGSKGMTAFYSSYNRTELLKNEADQEQLSEPKKIKTHISIWRQKTRVRVYMDEKKIWDLPRAITENLKMNSLYFCNNGTSESEGYYVGNIRLAVGAPDTRNKLVNEGKFVTHGILFDVNSDQIKPESYGAIKDIAAVLTENADMNVLIVGHTDSDGNDASNMELSKKRAAAVKSFLIKEFAVSAGRLSTDGKGESEPIEKNTSTEGKANNRRVEFIKQ